MQKQSKRALRRGRWRWSWWWEDQQRNFPMEPQLIEKKKKKKTITNVTFCWFYKGNSFFLAHSLPLSCFFSLHCPLPSLPSLSFSLSNTYGDCGECKPPPNVACEHMLIPILDVHNHSWKKIPLEKKQKRKVKKSKCSKQKQERKTEKKKEQKKKNCFFFAFHITFFTMFALVFSHFHIFEKYMFSSFFFFFFGPAAAKRSAGMSHGRGGTGENGIRQHITRFHFDSEEEKKEKEKKRTEKLFFLD